MNISRLYSLHDDVKHVSNKEKGIFLQRFFKTGKGEYGEGDVFVGLTVPQSRQIAKKYRDLPLSDIKKLLSSKIHEERLIALFILVDQFQRAGERGRKMIMNFYLASTKHINNWDLVDSSADKIVGGYLLGKDTSLLQELARSKSLWERRIAMIATYQFIKNGDYKPTLQIAEILLSDRHDLIQKAVGWMLREVGKRCSRDVLTEFLNTYRRNMGRTALRYTIEHFSENERKQFLSQ